VNTPAIRVMIVDDSLIVRKLVEDALHQAPGIEIVGTAPNGRVALEKIGALRPDVITLDVEMPELDGLSTLRRIKAEHAYVHVIMFSSLTVRSASITLDALHAGAADYVAKPEGTGGMTATRERIREELVPKIQALCSRPSNGMTTTLLPMIPQVRPRTLPAATPRLIAIGVSTGGPAALHEVVSALPASLGVPLVIVQHMPAEFTSQLAQRLAGVARMPVAEARHGDRLAPDRVWIAPGGLHLVVARRGADVVLTLDDGPAECSCKPSVDVLFRSVASVYGASALGIVLTGMGQDGRRGCEAIREAGGTVIAQDAGTSVVWGMPGAVVRAGLADRVLPLGEIAPAIDAATRALRRPPPGRSDVRGRA
jgi:two-component system chemotaxis response regulator CheB